MDEVPLFFVLLVVVSLLLPVMLLAIWILISVCKVRESSRLADASARERAGLCVQCGYDVRDSGDVCSECGMPIWRRRDPLTGKVLSVPARDV